MSPSVFLSHTSDDKPFVRRLAADLDAHGIRIWIDEAEISIGDSLIEKIRKGIDEYNFVAAIISPESVNSEWVKREIDVAMNQEIAGRKVKVLPIKYGDVEMPGFLLGKLYADFSSEDKYEEGLRKLVNSVGMVFIPGVLDDSISTTTLGTALDDAAMAGVPMMIAPFHRPIQYLGQRVSELVGKIGGEINAGGNLIVENDRCHLYLETEGDFVSYGQAYIKTLPPWELKKPFNPETILGAFSISPSELSPAHSATHYHAYYDHKRKLKVTVICPADGERLELTFGSKNYGH